MELTKKEYEILNIHRATMKQIIVDRAISTITVAFREDVLQLAKDKRILNCNCSSGIFTAVSRLYNAMLAYEAQKRSNLRDESKQVETQSAAPKKTKKSK